MKLALLIVLLCVPGLLIGCGPATPVAQLTPAAASPGTAGPNPTATAMPVSTVPPASTSRPDATGSPAVTVTAQLAATVPPERLAEAEILAEQFMQGDYEAVVQTFDVTMTQVFPIDQVQQARVSLQAQVGDFIGTQGTRAEKIDEYDVVFVTLAFERAVLDLRVVYNQAGEVAGLFFQPTQSTPYPTSAPPAYADADAFGEQEVTVGSGDWALPGTLTLPRGDGPFPAVVLVHGSGPQDRDESAGPNKPFRDLAWGLASRGIAVLRYEKRTKAHAAQFTPELVAGLTVKEETIDDALAAVELLRRTPGIDPDRITVLGHSLGGYLLPRIGAADAGIAGLIVLAGFTRPMEDLVVDQMTYLAGLDGSISAGEQAALDEVAAQVARVKSPELSAATPAEDLPLGMPANYLLDLRGYDPAALAQELGRRMLILQGARDYQVTTVDFEGWKAALGSRPDVEFKLYPDLNHLFMAGKGKSSPAEYETPGNVDEQVIVDIARWILQ